MFDISLQGVYCSFFLQGNHLITEFCVSLQGDQLVTIFASLQGDRLTAMFCVSLKGNHLITEFCVSLQGDQLVTFLCFPAG
jgi:hypothetical protein